MRQVTLIIELLPKTLSLLKKEPQAESRCGGEGRVESWQ